jgi:transposase-like protein
MLKGVRYRRWNPEDMERALETVGNGDVGLNKASREHSVLKATLNRHLDGKNYFATQGRSVSEGN